MSPIRLELYNVTRGDRVCRSLVIARIPASLSHFILTAITLSAASFIGCSN
jgi:hypothetical protein